MTVVNYCVDREHYRHYWCFRYYRALFYIMVAKYDGVALAKRRKRRRRNGWLLATAAVDW